MVEKWFTDEEVEVCEYCQCEIFPDSRIYVSNDLEFFDKQDCAHAYAKEMQIDDMDIVGYILARDSGKIKNTLLDLSMRKLGASNTD